ncbi:MAG: polyphosphate kinase 1 [Verrucomicrobiae bacterium]|nr:polyphosphate kinase 1 [Verrucomicrobiae bacterium]
MSRPSEPHAAPRFLNRELSWLEFNHRVLEEARDPSNPLFERVKFFCIASSNLDEFFEVRVAGLRQQVAAGVQERSPDGLLPIDTLESVRLRIRRQVEDLYRCWRDDLVPELARQNIHFLAIEDLSPSDLAWLDTFYREQVHPVLSPLGIDQSHPFPHLVNKMLNVVVRLLDPTGPAPVEKLGVVQVPGNLPRLVRLPRTDGRHDFVLLGRVIGHFLGRLFTGMRILGHWNIRVTRNGELYIDSESRLSVLRAVENELQHRFQGEAVRLEVDHECPPDVCQTLLDHLHLGPEDLYRIDGPLHPGRIAAIGDGVHRPDLKDAPHIAPLPAGWRGDADLFAAIRERDILVHHPYESFETVIAFLQQAASDPQVLAIKQTLYRTGGDPRIFNALTTAARLGKQVTAIVELQARFDERNNIDSARKLEEAGVHVVYGLLGYKIHAKVALVVRAEPEGIRRYLHLSTGNYNATTSRIYTDLGLFTCRRDFGEDATALFNLLTGICQFQPMRRFLVAPFELHRRVLEFIQQEARNAQNGLPARIVAKMNSLVDPAIIEALYEASRLGVSIDLVVRGICCLRAGVPGLSDNIRVRSIVDRFLEHSRMYYFENAANPRLWIGSADWMPRNFFRRIEVFFPILDGTLRDRLIHEILAANLQDNARARLLRPDGTYSRTTPGQADPPPFRCQQALLLAAQQRHSPSDPAATGPTASRRRPPRVTVRRRPDPE